MSVCTTNTVTISKWYDDVNIYVCKYKENIQTLGRYTDEGYIIKSNDLILTLRDRADFGVYFCVVRNSTAQFNVKEYSKKQMAYFSLLILPPDYTYCHIFNPPILTNFLTL